MVDSMQQDGRGDDDDDIVATCWLTDWNHCTVSSSAYLYIFCITILPRRRFQHCCIIAPSFLKMTQAQSNQVHPEPHCQGGSKVAMYCTPSDVGPQSNLPTNNGHLSWRIVFFVVIVNIAFSGAVCAIVVLGMNPSVEHVACDCSKSIEQLSASQKTLNATLAQSIANQQTLNATVAQSTARQKNLNYTLNALLLDGNAVCFNAFDSVSCGCKVGYSGNSFSCSDVDECILNSHNCPANSSCINTVGSFNCSCKPGFSGNGYECSDIDECALNTHYCISIDSCRNTPGGYFCRQNGISQISAGGQHTCALTASGAAKCWGFGGGGRLGNGATSDSNTPVDVSGMSSGVIAISAGLHHTCALTASGAAKCWGFGSNGRLGNGATSDSNTPVDVSGMSSGVVAISVGDVHSCALTASGAAKCWGSGGNGKLGDGATVDSFTPSGVSGMSSGVIAISAGVYHTCALTASGAAKCWGLGNSGRLGNGVTSGGVGVSSNTPVDVSGMSSGMIAISASEAHTCALTASGAAKCWGLGNSGRLGNGTTSTSITPVDVSGMSSGVIAISAGVSTHLRADGIWCSQVLGSW